MQDETLTVDFYSPTAKQKACVMHPPLCRACRILVWKPPLEQLSVKFQHAHSYPMLEDSSLKTSICIGLGHVSNVNLRDEKTAQGAGQFRQLDTKRVIQFYQHSKSSQGGNAV